PLMKPRSQVLLDFVAGKRRSATLKFPAIVTFFGYQSFTGPPFVTPMVLLDLSCRRHHFSTGLDRYLITD
ncbi:hypothetical protein TorRG33x02_276570, partial [Trema orientale]